MRKMLGIISFAFSVLAGLMFWTNNDVFVQDIGKGLFLIFTMGWIIPLVLASENNLSRGHKSIAIGLAMAILASVSLGLHIEEVFTTSGPIIIKVTIGFLAGGLFLALALPTFLSFHTPQGHTLAGGPRTTLPSEKDER